MKPGPNDSAHVDVPTQAVAGAAGAGSRGATSLASDSGAAGAAGDGFHVSPSALRAASAAVRGVVTDVQARTSLACTGSTEDVVRAAGRAKPVEALRRFLDQAHQHVRVGLADANKLADDLAESAKAYRGADQAHAEEFQGLGSESSPVVGAGTDRADQPGIPGPGTASAAEHLFAAHEPGRIPRVLSPESTAEQITRLPRSGRWE